MLLLDSRITGHGLRVDFYVGRLFSILIFLISWCLTRALPLSSLWDGLPSAADMWCNSHAEIAYLATVDFIFYLACLHAPVEFHLVNEGFRLIRIHRLAVRLLLIFDFSSGYLLPIDYLSLRHLGGSSCSWEFSTSLSYCFEFLFLGILYFFILSFWNSLPAWGSLFDLCVSWGRGLSCFTFRDFNFEMSRRGVTEW